MKRKTQGSRKNLIFGVIIGVNKMEKYTDEILMVIYNFYIQGCVDGEVEYSELYSDDEEYGDANKFKSFEEFKKQFKKDEETIKYLEKDIYLNGFVDSDEIKEKKEEKKEKEKLKVLGLKKYLDSKFQETRRLEKSAYYQLIIRCTNKKVTLDELKNCIREYALSSGSFTVTGFEADDYDLQKVLEEHHTSVSEVVGGYNKNNSFSDIKRCVLIDCVLLKMQDIVSKIERIMEEKWKKKLQYF